MMLIESLNLRYIEGKSVGYKFLTRLVLFNEGGN